MTSTTDDKNGLDLLRSSRIVSYSLALLLLAGGIALLAWPGRSVIVVARLIGVVLIVIGFGQALEAITTHRRGSYWGLLLLRGVINLGIGVALLFIPEKSTDVIVWLIALDFVITGVLALIVAFMMPKDTGRGVIFVEGLLSIGVGIAIWAIGPSHVKDIAAIVVGILLIVWGLIFLWTGWELSKARRELDRA